MLVLILDLGTNAKRYIHFYNWKDYFYKNELANFLRKDPDIYRVKVFGVQEHPLLNQLVSNILPFHRIPVVDPPAVSRMARDYDKFFGYAKAHQIMRSDRYFDLFNVKYVLSLQPFSDPYATFTPVAQWNGIHVSRRDDFMPRAWLAPSSKVVRDGEDAVLFATLHPALNLRETVVLEEPPQAVLVDGRWSMVNSPVNGPHVDPDRQPARPSPKKDVLSPKKPLGNKNDKSAEPHPSTIDHRPSTLSQARITRYEDNRLEVETVSDKPAMLVMSEKWDPDWKAWLDEKPAKIYKANFLMRAVEVPPGKHTVLMEYRPSIIPFWISSVSVLVFGLCGIIYAFRCWSLPKVNGRFD